MSNAKSLDRDLEETHWVRSSTRDTMVIAKGGDDNRGNQMNYKLDKRTIKALQYGVT